jgi:hypothetical protein
LPTIPINLQADGPYMGLTSIIGASTAVAAVDDSVDGSVNDGDTTCIRLPRLTPTVGFASFYAFKGAESLIPISISITAIARKEGANGPGMHLGLRKGSTLGIGAVQPLSQTYGPITQTIVVNPFTGQAWAQGDLADAYLYIRNEDGGVGQTRVTLLYGLLTYAHRIASRYGGRYREGGAR